MSIKYLYHISDIHIRLYERQELYLEVFENFYKQLKNIPNKELCLVVFTGDLVHDKITLSPESVTLAHDFLKNVSDILPIVMIQGNHDSNYNNKARMDSLTPIVKSLKKKNIHYLTLINDTLLYENLNFYFVTDKNVDNIKFLDNSNKNIGLYHGVVNDCIADNGRSLKSNNMNVSKLQKFDYTLLGDVHKYQELRLNIIYAGSMIQQKFNESLNHHGYVLWNLLDNKHIQHNILNSYGFVEIVLNLNTNLDEITIPSNARVKLHYSTDNKIKLDFVKLLKTKCNIMKLTLINTNINKDLKTCLIQDLKGIHSTDSVTDIKYQENLIETYLSLKYKDFETYKESIFKINELINKQVKTQSLFLYNLNLLILNIRWSNMFSYGLDNYLDFSEDSNKLVGIIGLNRMGKSSTVDVILFTLFDKCSRSTTGNDVLNRDKNLFTSRVLFLINKLKFYIIRLGKRLKKVTSVKIDVLFGKILLNGLIKLLNGDKRSETNKIIQKYLGYDYDTFCNVYTSLQDSSSSSFIKQKQTDRKNFINKIFGIDYIESLYSIANNSIDKVSKLYLILLNLISNINKLLLDGKLIKNNLIITQNKDKLEIKTKRKQLLSSNILLVNKSLKAVDSNISGLNKLTLLNTIKLNEKKKEEYLTKKKAALLKIKLTNDKIKVKTKLIETYDKEKLSLSLNSDKLLDKEIVDINITVTKLQQLINSIQKSNSLLNDLKYDKDCTYCMNNPFVLLAILNKNSIEGKLKLLKKQKKLLELNTNKKKLLLKDKLLYNTLLSELNLKNKLSNLLVQLLKILILFTKLIDKFLKAIEQSKENIKKLEECMSNIQYNKKIHLLILKAKQEIQLVDTLIIQINKDISYLESLNDSTEKLLLKLEKLLKQKELKLLLYKSLKYYHLSVHRNGIPLLVLKDLLPRIEGKCNLMLATITNFSIKFVILKDNLLLLMKYDNLLFSKLIELGSGFERFITNLIIKIAFSEVSSLNTCNLFIVDEGFGSMDSKNLGNLGDLFLLILLKIQNPVIISHIVNVINYIDVRYNVYMDNGFSKLDKL